LESDQGAGRARAFPPGFAWGRSWLGRARCG